MKNILRLFLILTLIYSCSDEKTTDDLTGFAINGRLLAPNGTDPIPNAMVSARSNNTVVAESFTDVQGQYALSLPKGNYELTFTKGKFSGVLQIDVEGAKTNEDALLDILPTIGVVTGHFDHIEHVLLNIGLVDPITQEPLFDIIEGNNFGRPSGAHGHRESLHMSQNKGMMDEILLEPNVDFNFEDLMNDPALLGSYDILFLNCGLNESLEDMGDVLMDYVYNGGILYATDWAAGYLNDITNGGADYMTFYDPEKSGTSLTTTATLLDTALSDWLELNFDIVLEDTIEIDEFLSSWQVVDSYDTTTTISWLEGEVSYRDSGNNIITETKDLAFTFLHGDGAVFYSSFHTENYDPEFSDVDRIMEFFVFEMSVIQP